ncbi:hypothetical protein [Escherichia coli]|nr:hypothetical protein [Escherichia coli]
MNYAGHEKLRAEVAEVANAMCDLRTTMNEMERRYSFNADTLPERLVRQTLFRANRLLMGKRLVRTVLIFTERSDQLSRATDRVPGLPTSPGYVQ